ncbi:MerC mercury resistance protein [Reichenbachiella agariperforans]|uniref:MerC mercury resistance protein n=1 Tax=Reichenbachiella agariperforans TaxID=156994 RepID=A0A1M6SHM9_REIAG|nr:MerC domain-containing protein [Reichenbachiella agariperforans]SHK44028.1 MerC mercury resistance protein [Reichenbachiella agariperforans]
MKQYLIGIHADWIGLIASFVCALHCLLMPVALSLAPMLAGYMNHPALEAIMIGISVVIASYAIGRGYYSRHRRLLPVVILCTSFLLITMGRFSSDAHVEVWMTSSGAFLIAVAHAINWKMLNLN